MNCPKTLKRIISSILSVIFLGSVIFGFGIIVSADSTIEAVFNNDIRGSADCEIKIFAADGDYEIYWGDENQNKLSGNLGTLALPYASIAQVNVTDGVGAVGFNRFTAIPDNAATLLLFLGEEKIASYEIPDEKKFDNGAKLHSFGVLSDIHYNRYFSSGGDDAVYAFGNALDTYDKTDISIVAACGDISNLAEANSFVRFSDQVKNRKYPVYSSTGNHDAYYNAFNAEVWRQYVNSDVYAEGTAHPGVLNISENGIDFVYEIPGSASRDVFIFFNQGSNSYNSASSVLVSQKQLDWLAEQLEAYKDKTVYLFFHTFLCDINTGDESNCEGNLINSGGYTYDLAYTYGTADEVRFRELLGQYKNVIFFNGHTHWKFDMQSFNDRMNIDDYNGNYATLVHVSSVTSPRMVADEDTDRTDLNNVESEGYYASVYNDCVVLTAVDFKHQKLLPYATFLVTTDKEAYRNHASDRYGASDMILYIILYSAALIAVVAAAVVVIKMKKTK